MQERLGERLGYCKQSYCLFKEISLQLHVLNELHCFVMFISCICESLCKRRRGREGIKERGRDLRKRMEIEKKKVLGFFLTSNEDKSLFTIY